jgi:N-acetylmuramoyl-L-alanine amidase
MVKATSRQNRGLRFARFRVLVLSHIPAALIEAGFVSHAQEEQDCGLIANQRKIAESIADALVFFR